MALTKKRVIILSVAFVLPLLVACAVSPVSAIVLLPVILAFTCALSFAAGAWVIAAAGVLYFAASVPLWGFHPFTSGAAVTIAVCALPATFCKRLKPVAFIGVTAAVGAVAVFGFLGIFAIAKGCSITTLITSSYGSLLGDPVLSAISRGMYKNLGEADLGHVPLLPNDEMYLADAVSYYASTVAKELEGATVWFVTGFGAFGGGICALGGFALSQACGQPTPCRGFTAVRDLRLGREYVFIAVLPALCFAFLAFYEPMVPVVITVVNLMVTLPGCLCGITLFYHIATLPRGKIRILTVVAFWLIAALLAFFYEWGMLVYGFVGLADSILNVRKLLDWALRPPEE